MLAFVYTLILYRLYIKEEVNIMNGKNREKGVTTVEYAVMLILIAIAVMAANPNVGSAVVNVFSNITAKLAPAA